MQIHAIDARCNVIWWLDLIGICQQAQTDVQIVLEGLGLEKSSGADAEEAAMKDVMDVLKPHMGVAWQTGNPTNRT